MPHGSRSLPVVIAASLLATAAHAEAPVTARDVPGAWGFSASDLTPDPAVRYGILPNGMRFAIMKNAKPLHSASIRLRISMGSTAESDKQRGLAHFLEHMAFNGTTNVPEGEMVKLLERNGLAFGADTNASTSFNETVYKLDLPEVNDALVDTGLFLMREVASEMTLEPGAIDRERGIILGELRARENYAMRNSKDYIGFAVPGSPAAERFISGDEEVIRTAPAAEFRDLYSRYYTPDRATLVIVGDIDPAAVEAKIRAKFASWKAKGKAPGDPAAAKVDPARPTEFRLFEDKDVPTGVSILAVRPYVLEPDTRALRERRLLETIGNAALNRRLVRLQREPGAKFASGAAGTNNFLATARVSDLSVTARERDWEGALTLAEEELRRALTHGFSQAEIDEQMAALRSGYRNAVEQAPTRTSGALAETIIGTLEPRAVFTTPQSSLDRFEALAPTVTPERVNAAFRAAWSGANPQVRVAHNAPIAGGIEAIRKAYAVSAAKAVAAPVSAASTKFAYTDFGTPGTVATDTRVTDLDIRRIRFANNVRLNIKRTDFEKGVVRVSLRIGGGISEMPAKPDGLGTFLSSAFAAGGTAAHSADDLQSLLAGKTVGRGFGAATDYFGGTYATVPQDLELQLQLLAAYATAPGYRAEAEAQWKTTVGVFYPTLESQPQAIIARDVTRILASGDTRFGFPSEADARARSFAELKPVLAGPLFRGPVEIGIVGDVDEAAAIAAVARTFGALPPRMENRPDYGAARPVSFPKSRAPIVLTHSGKPNQAMALNYWPTTDGFDDEVAIRLSLLGRVLQLMLTDELRERLGATYSPSGGSSTSSLFKGYGYLAAISNVEPGRIAEVNAAVDAIAARLAEKPVDADTLLRARKPMLESFERQKRENGFWIGLVDEAQSEPKDLEDYRRYQARLNAVTAAELQALARQYMKPAEELRISIVPREAAPQPAK